MKKPSPFYRSHNHKPPKEHPIYTYAKWRFHVTQTKEVIGYEEWLAKQIN